MNLFRCVFNECMFSFGIYTVYKIIEFTVVYKDVSFFIDSNMLPFFFFLAMFNVYRKSNSPLENTG